MPELQDQDRPVVRQADVTEATADHTVPDAAPEHPTPSLAVMREAWRGADSGPGLLHAARVHAHASGITYDPWASNRELVDIMEGQTVDAALALAGRSSSKTLPTAVRARLEQAFDHDFSHVRIHTDGAAAAAAEALSAHAFALGADVFFGPGEYAPDSPAGDRLLVHELTHVVQHDEGRLPQGGGVSSPSDPAEREAYTNERVLTPILDSMGADVAPVAAPAPTADAPILRDVEEDDEELDLPRYSKEEVEAALSSLSEEHGLAVVVSAAEEGKRCDVEIVVPPPEGGWPKELCTRGDQFSFTAPTDGMLALAEGLGKIYADDEIRFLAGLALGRLEDGDFYLAWDEELPIETSGMELLEAFGDTDPDDDEVWLDHVRTVAPFVADTAHKAIRVHDKVIEEMSSMVHIQLPGQQAATFQHTDDIWMYLNRLRGTLEAQAKPLKKRLAEDADMLTKFESLPGENKVTSYLVQLWVDDLTAPSTGLFAAALGQIAEADKALADVSAEDLGSYYTALCTAYLEVNEAVDAVCIHYQAIEAFMVHRTRDIATSAQHIRTVRDELWMLAATIATGPAGKFVSQLKWLEARGLGKAAAYVTGQAIDLAGKAASGLADDIGDGKPTDWKKLLRDQALGQATNLVPKATGMLSDKLVKILPTIDRGGLSARQGALLAKIEKEGIEFLKDGIDEGAKMWVQAELEEALGVGDGKLPPDFDDKIARAMLMGILKRSDMEGDKNKNGSGAAAAGDAENTSDGEAGD